MGIVIERVAISFFSCNRPRIQEPFQDTREPSDTVTILAKVANIVKNAIPECYRSPEKPATAQHFSVPTSKLLSCHVVFREKAIADRLLFYFRYSGGFRVSEFHRRVAELYVVVIGGVFGDDGSVGSGSHEVI